MGFSLSAVHVNHGISQNATLWSEFCSNLCHDNDIPITVTTLSLCKVPGVSLEASAREARYQVFNRLTADYIVLAQHLDDQAETVLLQLLRGAGVRGLSAMPVSRPQTLNTAPHILRPLLDVTRKEIEEYAHMNGLKWVMDESNYNTVFDRNFLRHNVLPAIQKQYPAYQKAIMRSSRHLAEASNLLDELAQEDAKQYVISGRLRIDAIHHLSAVRAKNLLRFLFAQHKIKQPSTVKLADILQQLRQASNDAHLHIPFGEAEIRCYKRTMYILPRSSPPDPLWSIPWNNEKQIIIHNPSGIIQFENIQGMGIDPEKLMQAPVTIRLRQGGERFQPDCKRPNRSLKNLLQEASIPPWERQICPLLFSGKKLVWVPGIGIDCSYQVESGNVGLVPDWIARNKSLVHGNSQVAI